MNFSCFKILIEEKKNPTWNKFKVETAFQQLWPFAHSVSLANILSKSDVSLDAVEVMTVLSQSYEEIYRLSRLSLCECIFF